MHTYLHNLHIVLTRADDALMQRPKHECGRSETIREVNIVTGSRPGTHMEQINAVGHVTKIRVDKPYSVLLKC